MSANPCSTITALSARFLLVLKLLYIFCILTAARSRFMSGLADLDNDLDNNLDIMDPCAFDSDTRDPTLFILGSGNDSDIMDSMLSSRSFIFANGDDKTTPLALRDTQPFLHPEQTWEHYIPAIKSGTKGKLLEVLSSRIGKLEATADCPVHTDKANHFIHSTYSDYNNTIRTLISLA
ncbi:hypothetical protein HanXRQr2_Chr14g0636861 [Helianthus annuus]|uniref:Uncharacterized protein n=1 Tax=Helianthus annuus TaxID=4232 RepID=A0A9K3E9I8_HELAN|nr:hypothetical protein HanXRQr2_Chr14g0636861 [Helianthus annuus]KAJ0839774.1 hypothetical protein HanPSC8_Chr14g0610851 [Helianthus annuus]